MRHPLEGRTVALAEGRQLEELARLLEAEGATILRCPMVSIRDVADPAPGVAWLRELIADQFRYVILLTGEGLRRLLGVSERAGLRAAVVSALSRTRIVTRGPKPVQALKEIGLRPYRIAPTPTTEGVIATLSEEPLRGCTVGLQLYGESNPVLTQFLEAAGAAVRSVVPYEYAPGMDADQIALLIQQMAQGQVDLLVFTSSPQVERLLEVAGRHDLESAWREGLSRTRIAAVGPVVSQTLQDKGVRVDICPEQGFVMKNLVRQIARQLGTDQQG